LVFGGSGANRTASPPPRTADNFVTRPCKDQDVCLIDAVIYTDCNPVTGFVEIYSSDCRLPVGAPIATLVPTSVIPLNVSYCTHTVFYCVCSLVIYLYLY